MLHSGLDLHKRTLAIATVDAEGRHVRDVQLSTKRELITAYFRPCPAGRRRSAPWSSPPPTGTGSGTCSRRRGLTSGWRTRSM